MIVGVPKEIKLQESRVSVTPHGASELKEAGHTVLVEQSAGVGSGFTDEEYAAHGAEICAGIEPVYSRSDMIVKVKEPSEREIALLREGAIMFTYFHFAASKELTKGFLDTAATGLAYETLELPNGSLPLLMPMSEVAGRMAVQEGAKYLETRQGGKGVLLGGVPGVEPATVMVLGGGVVGSNAAKIASGLGAQVYVLDTNLERLRYLDDTMPKNVITLFSNRHNITSLLPKTDLLVGAVLIVGSRAPNLVTKDMLSLMEEGTVVVDVAVDQGGCVETSKPTSHEAPIYEVDGVIHYCVPNMPGAVPITSTLALTNSTLPYLLIVANNGLAGAVELRREIATAVNTCKGHITHKGVAEAFDLDYRPPVSVLN
ncbi:MAG: alanine dehydrogenase [Candidatus Neomarinimicrobiota bacterium]